MGALRWAASHGNSLSRIEASENYDVLIHVADSTKHVMEAMTEFGRARFRTNDVVRSSSDGDKRRHQSLESRNLMISNLIELAPPHGQVRIAELRHITSKFLGHEVGPAPQGSVRPHIPQALGETVAKGDEGVKARLAHLAPAVVL